MSGNQTWSNIVLQPNFSHLQGLKLLFPGRQCKNFALVTRILQLVASVRLTTLFHATIITQTVASIFSQIVQNKI